MDALASNQNNMSAVSSWESFAQTDIIAQPTFYSDGGFQGCSYLSFNRQLLQYLNGTTSMRMNASTNGGFTVVVSVRFPTDTISAFALDTVFLFQNGIYSDLIALYRSGKNSLTLQVMKNNIPTGGEGSSRVISLGCGQLYRGEWATWTVRYNASSGFAEIFKNGVPLCIGGSQAIVSDKLMITSYIGRYAFNVPDNTVTMDLGALFIFDYALSDSQIETITQNLTQKLPIERPPMIPLKPVPVSFQSCCELNSLSLPPQGNGTSVSSWGGFNQARSPFQPTLINSGDQLYRPFLSFSPQSFLFGGARALYVATRGGFTAVVMVRFRDSVLSGQRLFSFYNGAGYGAVTLSRSGGTRR